MDAALRSCRTAFIWIALLSCVVNVLMLTSSIYMMQVYDRVLGSRSIPTLITLSVMAIAAYGVQWFFDLLRQRMMGFVGERVEQELAPAIQSATIDMHLRGQRSMMESLQLFRDLDTIRAFMSSQGPLSLFDLPWIPIYLVVCFILHPWLGWMTIGGAALLLALTLATEIKSGSRPRRP